MKIIWPFWLTFLTIPLMTHAETSVLLSDENIEITLKPGAIACAHTIPDYGYGAQPGAIYVRDEDISDQTLRSRSFFISPIIYLTQ